MGVEAFNIVFREGGGTFSFDPRGERAGGSMNPFAKV